MAWLVCFSFEVSAQSSPRADAEGDRAPSDNPFEVGSTVGAAKERYHWRNTGKEMGRLVEALDAPSSSLGEVYRPYHWWKVRPSIGVRISAIYALLPMTQTYIVVKLIFNDPDPPYRGAVVPLVLLGGVSLGLSRVLLGLSRVQSSAGAEAEAFIRFHSLYGDRAAINVSETDRRVSLSKAAEVNSSCVKSYRILSPQPLFLAGAGALFLEKAARSIPAYENARAEFLRRIKEKAGW
jgi:hypothetical protein